MTPDLYTLILVAAQQIAGDQVALHLAETGRKYLAYGGRLITYLKTAKLWE